MLSYEGVSFDVGNRLLLSFENKEWIVFEVPSTWGGVDAELDESGFRILGEVLFPDEVEVLQGRDLGFSLEGIDPEVSNAGIVMGAYALVAREDGTLIKFAPSWTDDEALYTSSVLGLDIDLLEVEHSKLRLLGAWDKVQ